MSTLFKALEFASKAHKGQMRKYSDAPYIIHPVAVAQILKKHHPHATDEMMSAALLHDTVEDCDVTSEQIRDKFGSDVSILVSWLTDVSQPSDGNRKQRKEIDRLHSSLAPHDAQLIKCADVIHNTSDIRSNGGTFAEVYLDECRALAKVFRKSVKETDIFKELTKSLL